MARLMPARRAMSSALVRRTPVRYSAFDPELQLWVAATLARNGEQLYERVFGPMDPATRERVYRDSWIFGTALQVTPEMWPQTRAEFETYWEESLALLEGDPAVQCYAKQLLSPQGQPFVTRLALPGAGPDDARQPRPADPRGAGPAGGRAATRSCTTPSGSCSSPSTNGSRACCGRARVI